MLHWLKGINMILSGYFWSFIDVLEFFNENERYLPLITLLNGVDLFEEVKPEMAKIGKIRAETGLFAVTIDCTKRFRQSEGFLLAFRRFIDINYHRIWKTIVLK